MEELKDVVIEDETTETVKGPEKTEEAELSEEAGREQEDVVDEKVEEESFSPEIMELLRETEDRLAIKIKEIEKSIQNVLRAVPVNKEQEEEGKDKTFEDYFKA